MGWIELHPGLAAWVQAIGSIAAIIAAILIGRSTIRAEERRIEARSRVIAFRLAPLLLTLHADIERALACTDEIRPGTTDFGRLSTLLTYMVLPTTIPDEIFAESWLLPRETALEVAQLENALREYATASNAMMASGSLGVIPQQKRDDILDEMRAMLMKADIFVLSVSNYCTRIITEASNKDA